MSSIDNTIRCFLFSYRLRYIVFHLKACCYAKTESGNVIVPGVNDP
ncbi:hypothetical protein ABIE50_006487 [Chitinophaga sp. OAE865]